MVQAKICGLSTHEGVDAALEGGATFVGFIFFPKSPRNIAPEDAGRLAMAARARGVKVVGVTVDPNDAEIDRIVAGLNPDFIQLHGSESPQRAVEIRSRTGKGIIKVLPVTGAEDFAAAWGYEPFVDHMMFEGKPPKDSTLPGGVGAKFDWSLLAGRSFPRPHFLAGGLDPWNVAEAVAQSGAPIVDVSSGVERGPGIKDPALIEAFLGAVSRI